ncbi:MAG: PilZ domain-containing protein [Hyphomicrobium sp.]|nr:PilZ domain-containing protein [Hyphomicrobium sp.]
MTMMQNPIRYTPYEEACDDTELRLVKAWSHEFLHLAMMSAFVAMGCNAVLRDNRAHSLAEIEPNIPEAPAIYRAIRQGLLELPQRYSLAMLAAQDAYGVVGKAIDAFNNVQAMEHSSGYVMRSVLEVLANNWRQAATSLHRALDVFDDSGLLRSPTTPASSIDTQCPWRIRQLLMTAASGETLAASEFASARRGNLPDWVERRRWDRQNFNKKCVVIVRGTPYEATIRNISLGGALLCDMPPLIRMTPLTIETDARRLPASVMWARDHALGVKFDEQLHHDDPLVVAQGD